MLGTQYREFEPERAALRPLRLRLPEMANVLMPASPPLILRKGRTRNVNVDRLRRSTGGAVTDEEAQDNLKQQPVCPEMWKRDVSSLTELMNLISGYVTTWTACT
jgi:hypothetical protein